MRAGSRKFDYSRAEFGQSIRARRLSLGLSYRQFAQHIFEQSAILLAAGTILHVERGDRSLPESQRAALESVLNPSPNTDILWAREAALFSQVTTLDAPSALEEMSRWDDARDGYLREAAQARDRDRWSDWAGYMSRAGLMEMMLGDYNASAKLLDAIIDAGANRVGLEALSASLQDRGWLSMARHDYSSATHYLLKSGEIIGQLGMSRTRTFHFLGRTYCAWGIAQDNARFREAGRNLLMRAYTLDKSAGNDSTLGFDLLQQIPSMIWDDVASARKYLYQSQELLGTEGYMAGHFHLKSGLVAHYSGHAGAREHWERAATIYAQGIFYSNGVGEALRLQSRALQERSARQGYSASLPEAATYAFVAAVAHPYRESLTLLEEVSAQLFLSSYYGVIQHFMGFWEGQIARVRQMDEEPFNLLRALAQRPDGVEYIEASLRRVQHAIRESLPGSLSPRELHMATHCLPTANVP